MNEYDLWMEGFELEVGIHQHAIYMGRVTGDNFRKACKARFTREDGKIDPNYNVKKNSLWGSRLYSNEQAARKAHG